jgi:PAS domain S-box-containing protein
VPATLVDAVSHAPADVGSIPTVSMLGCLGNYFPCALAPPSLSLSRESRSTALHGKRRFGYGRLVTEGPEDEHRYQALVTDRDGVIRRWESECVGVFGYSSEEAIGKTLDLVVPPALQARHWRGFNRAVASGQLKRPGKTLKVPAVHKSGKIISLQIDNATLIPGADGPVDAVTVAPSIGPVWVAALSRPVLFVLGFGRSR